MLPRFIFCNSYIHYNIFICYIAIAYSMGQIIKVVWVCASVYMSISVHSHGPISWSIFTKIGTAVKPTKVKTSLRVSTLHHPFPYFASSHILGQEVLKIYASINNPTSALNVCELPKFLHLLRNQGGGTRWWCQIWDWKWKYGRFVHVKNMQYNAY